MTLLGIKFKFPKTQYRELKKQQPFYKYKKQKIDITTIPKAVGQIRDIQLANLELLKELDYVCKQNNLTYWLDFGTLLGAVRHKGFIPWDDDIDTGMLREDYNKIIDAFAKSSRNPDIYAGIFVDKKNNCYIKVLHKKCNLLFVDIFPYDYYPKISEKEQLKLTEKIKSCLTKSIMKCKSREEILEEIQNFRNSFYMKPIINKEEADLVCGFDYWHNYKNWFYSRDYFFPLTTLEFENINFPVPKSYEKYLQRTFGNYMEYPKKIGMGHSMFLKLSDTNQDAISKLINKEVNL